MPKRAVYLIKWFSVIEVNLQSEALGADGQYPSEVYFRGVSIRLPCLSYEVLQGVLRTALGAHLPDSSVQTFPQCDFKHIG